MNISGMALLIIGILFFVLLGGGLYMYFIRPELVSSLFSGNNKAVDEITQPIVTGTITPTIEPAVSVRPSGTAKESYLAYRSEVETATTVEAYIAAFSKYGSSTAVARLLERKTQLESVGSQGDLLTRLKGDSLPQLDGTENIQEATTDTASTLTVTKTNGRQIGTIRYIAENSQWKIEEETWVTASEESSLQGGTVKAGPDDDQDGLTNAEEGIFGTNSKASDSDADNYGDLEELNNGYNPAGEGKLAANKNLGTYLNTTFSFSLLYPLEWERTIASTDDSVTFTASDGQFVQVLIQPNSNKDEIIDWYKQTFNVDTVPTSQLVVTATWSGVRTPDGQTVYLTGKDKTYIYVLTYNTSNGNVLNYKNIFEMLLRGLNLSA